MLQPTYQSRSLARRQIRKLAGELVTAFILMTLLTLGCSFETQDGVGLATSGARTSLADAGASLDRVYTNQPTTSVGGDGCASNSFAVNTLPPDLLIVLDRSGSMSDDATGAMCAGGCGANSKWTQMTKAINQVVSGTQQKIRWGLKLFASGSDFCSVNAQAEVSIGPMNAAAIASAIAGVSPGSATPTRSAETQAAAYLASVQDPNPKYILLATDGLPNCQEGGAFLGADDAAAIAAVGAVAAKGIQTFVIGIATGGSGADGTLNMMAMKGGRPRAASPQYYPVTTAQDLESALTVIENIVALPCQFQLGGVPSDLGAVSVLINGQAVPMSDWTYGSGNASIVFPDSGSICAQLKSGDIKDVKIDLPCGETIIP